MAREVSEEGGLRKVAKEKWEKWLALHLQVWLRPEFDFLMTSLEQQVQKASVKI